MISNPIENPMIAISVKVYQVLLATYPAKFRKEYGSHMLQVFRDCCLRTFYQGGTNAMFRLWAMTILDIVQSVVSEHAQKEIEMKKEMKPGDIRLAGWALMVGSVVFCLGMFIGSLQNENWYVMIALMSLIGMPLLAFGLLGLRRRYGDQAGVFGKNILLIGAVFGSLMSIIGYIGEVGSFGRVYYDLWPSLILAGPIVLFAGLVLFGMVALFKKPLPRWNMVPVIAGAWYPIFFLAYFIVSLRTGDWDSFEAGAPEWFVAVATTLLILQGIALVALGYILKSDVLDEVDASA